jgi:hypothetical protein
MPCDEPLLDVEVLTWPREAGLIWAAEGALPASLAPPQRQLILPCPLLRGDGVAGFDSDAAARHILRPPHSRATVVDSCSDSCRRASASFRASRNRDGLADAHEAQMGLCPELGSRSIS